MILGIDPGLANLGWAIIDGEELVDYGCLETEVDLLGEERLEVIYKEIDKLCVKFKIESLAVESLFFAKNEKSAMKVAEAIGVVKLCAKKNKVKVFEYSPLQIKTTLVGYGRAEKNQVEEMVGRLLNLKNKIEPSHASDAVAVAMTHIRLEKMN